jgi:hypothetical protein
MSKWISHDGIEVSAEEIPRLTKRVMDDGRIGRLEACNFVKTMFPGKTGWDVLLQIEELSKAKAKAMYAGIERTT